MGGLCKFVLRGGMRSARLTVGGIALFRICLIASGLIVQVACTLGGQEGEDLTPTGVTTLGDTDPAGVTGTASSTDGTDTVGTTTGTGLDTAPVHTGQLDTGLTSTTTGGPASCEGSGPVLLWGPRAAAEVQGRSSSDTSNLQLRVAWSEDEDDPMQSELQIFALGNRGWTPGSDTQLSWRWPRGLASVDVDGSAVRQETGHGEWLLFSGTLTASEPACWLDERILSVSLTDGNSTTVVRHETTLGELRLESLQGSVLPGLR